MVFYRKLTLIWPHVLKAHLKALILNGLSSIFFEMIQFWFPLLKFLLYTWKVFLFHLMMSEKKIKTTNLENLRWADNQHFETAKDQRFARPCRLARWHGLYCFYKQVITSRKYCNNYMIKRTSWWKNKEKYSRISHFKDNQKIVKSIKIFIPKIIPLICFSC